MSGLKLVKITLNNVLGIDELEINPTSNILEISGRNGQGKTSIMEGIKDSLGISEYSQLLRNGEKKGQTVIDLGDMVITRNYKESGGTTKLEERSGITGNMSQIGKPSNVIKSLLNPESVDPVRLLTAKPRELADAVLRALPMTVDPTKLRGIVGDKLTLADSTEHALLVLSGHTGRIMEDRKLINRDSKTYTISAEQLRGTLPDDIPVAKELEDQISDNLEKMEGIRGSARKAGRKARGLYTEKLVALSEEFEELDDYIQKQADKLATAKEERATKSAEHQALLNEQSKAAEDASNDELKRVDEYQTHNTELSGEIASLKVYENTQSQVKEWDNKVAGANKASDELTKQLKSIEAYKFELCQDLPIEGLALTDGKLSFDGIPFQTLNTASKIDLVLELAKLSSGTLGLVMLDNAECLDDITYASFLEKAGKTDLTFIVASVRPHDLEIK
ncbi:hypothetical protein COPG_00034 [Colwellia phage 9A]|uniref:Rad50/SbcC-type AAA domain-containing protein n=1 Tax=Colwellia phage 9A TaxID=765765 RepID=I3UMB5_9CAUD|nr:hypothetical protein COPG_00034 [Colwellia phage 9A]AFK66630.1 hypothetical protein COPG_00034 [Colwellia phage 9A]